MTKTDLASFYTKRMEGFNVSLQAVKEKINVISNLRLAVALAFLVFLYLGLTDNPFLYPLPLLLIAFVLLVQRHSALFDQRVHLENLVKVQQSEQLALNGNYTSFPSGSEFIDTHHFYSHDLDVFGEGSLFQYVNRSHTYSGKKLMASRLSGKLDTTEKIIEHQNAVKELSNKTDFRHEIQASGMQVDELTTDRQQLERFASSPSIIFGKPFYKILITALPALTIALLIASFFEGMFSSFFWLCAVAQWLFLGLHIKKVNPFHESISKKKNILEKYARLLKAISAESFDATLLKEIKHEAQDADNRVTHLASLVGAFNARNSMATLLVNSLVMYDLNCVYRIEKWKKENGQSLLKWLDATHEMELLCSMGTLAFNNEEFRYPEINTERRLTARAMGHPLIAEEERIVNDVTLDNKESILIITGANMAGKSTFLRTLGVNVVLALNGSPVCAEEFHCPLIDIRSGMRTADSLRDHQSYFYAELNRLKSIVDELKRERQLLILLDEILKGTNSTDKQAGSIALVKQLVAYPSLVIIATHDLALGDLENRYPHKVRNYCFEPSIENDQLFFDYKLKPGLAQKMNATFLMRKMGIIEG